MSNLNVALPRVPCPWQGYEACKNCGLYGECFKLEAPLRPENLIDTGNDICQMIDELTDKARKLGINVGAQDGKA